MMSMSTLPPWAAFLRPSLLCLRIQGMFDTRVVSLSTLPGGVSPIHPAISSAGLSFLNALGSVASGPLIGSISRTDRLVDVASCFWGRVSLSA